MSDLKTIAGQNERNRNVFSRNFFGVMEYDILSAIHPDYNCSKIIGNYENIPVDRIETGDIVRYVTRTGASFKKVIYSGRLSESRFPNMFMAYPSKYFICDYSKIISVIRDEESARICSNGS